MDLSLKELALKAGVSQATASRILNGTQKVRPENLAKVEAVLAEHRYLPDAQAVNLARGDKSWPLVALTLPRYLTPFFTTLLEGVREGLAGQKIHLMLRDESPDNPAWIKALGSGRVGVLVFGRALAEGELETYRQIGLPYLLFDYNQPGEPCLVADGEEGGRAAANYLADQGVRKPWYVGTQDLDSGPQAPRWRGFHEAWKKRGITAQVLCLEVDGSSAGFLKAGREALNRLPWESPSLSPDGLFFYCDEMAMGAWQGRKIQPAWKENLPFIGYDGWSVTLSAGLATLDPRTREIGRYGAELMAKALHGEPWKLPLPLWTPVLRPASIY